MAHYTRTTKVPTPMTTDDLADTLSRLADAVRSGDSLEGSFEYLLPGPDDESHGCGDNNCRHVMVIAAFRVGNRNGQGGMESIGEYREVAA
jgi:hypothetical protein